jgi:hypothetical protein
MYLYVADEPQPASHPSFHATNRNNKQQECDKLPYHHLAAYIFIPQEL